MSDILRSFEEVNFEEVVGRDWSFTMTLKDTATGDVLDISGYTVTAKVRDTFDGGGSEPFTISQGSGFTIPDPTNGEVVVKMRLPDESIGFYEYDFTFDDAAGTKLSYLRGTLRVLGGL